MGATRFCKAHYWMDGQTCPLCRIAELELDLSACRDVSVALQTRIAELEEENRRAIEHSLMRYDHAIADVLALPTVTLGPMGTKAIPIFRIEALRGEGE